MIWSPGFAKLGGVSTRGHHQRAKAANQAKSSDDNNTPVTTLYSVRPLPDTSPHPSHLEV
jgi:hypothetical protein